MDDAVIFMESLEAVVMIIEALHEEVKLLIFCVKAKEQVFNDLLDEALRSVHACGENNEIFHNFTYLGRVVHDNAKSSPVILRRSGLT